MSEIKEWVRRMCEKVWREKEWIEEWNERIVIPVLKKEDGNRVENYRGVILTGTLYKIYADILAGKVREEVERKRLVPENQTRFRKRRGMMDNIYILNYVINKNVNKESGKLIVLCELKSGY